MGADPHRSVDTRMGVRTRSDRSVTSGASRWLFMEVPRIGKPFVRVAPGRTRPTAPRHPGPGRHFHACTVAPSTLLACPAPSPEPDCCRTVRQAGSVQGRRSRSRSDAGGALDGFRWREYSYGGFGEATHISTCMVTGGTGFLQIRALSAWESERNRPCSCLSYHFACLVVTTPAALRPALDRTLRGHRC